MPTRNSELIVEPFTFAQGRVPLLVSMPHPGTYIPESLVPDLTVEARSLPDTDWHVPRLYDFLDEIGASVLVATHSRYVIDLNRDPDGTPLYPGASNTELCPTALFNDRPIYLPGKAPGPEAIAARRDSVWEPYHRQLHQELQRLHARFGVALLLDAHSIRSEVPRFFEGRLPDLNLGTSDGAAAHPELASQLLARCRQERRYTSVLNGRFKGGYITRHYGRPGDGIHAVQLELSERIYMQEDAPYTFDEALAAQLRPLLKSLVSMMAAWAATAR